MKDVILWINGGPSRKVTRWRSLERHGPGVLITRATSLATMVFTTVTTPQILMMRGDKTKVALQVAKRENMIPTRIIQRRLFKSRKA